MAIIAPEDGSEYESGVKRKSNNARDIRVAARKKAARTAGGAPEVMAKVTGFSRGKSHAKSNLHYISRNGDFPLENERGEVISGYKKLDEFAKQWVSDLGDKKRRKDQRDTLHLIMSMPEGTEPEAVRDATRNFAKQVFGKNHEYVFALHTDTNSPHAHITIKTLGFDGKRLNPRKADLQHYREVFADAMEKEGVMANATPRRERFVVKKAVKQAILHAGIDNRSKRKAQQVKEAVDDLVAVSKGEAPRAEPWKAEIEARRQKVLANWKALAALLSNNDNGVEEDGRFTGTPGNGHRHGHGQRSRNASILAEHVRASTGFTGISLANSNGATGGSAAQPFTSLRNVSTISVVQHQSGTVQARAKMLLQSDALLFLAARNARPADHEMRRARASLDSNDARRGKSEEKDLGQAKQKQRGINKQAERLSDKELAEMVNSFISNIPAVETMSDKLKKELTSKFQKPVREQATRTAEPGHMPVIEKRIEKEKDLDP
jgi:type IV secretory pathway VirD2 relaxase